MSTIINYELPPMYWNNTDLLLNVDKSNIPEAGLGIFTYESIKKDQFIGYYEGVLKKEKDEECVGDYSFTLSPAWYLDARRYPRAYIAMINDSYKSKFSTNCEFVKLIEDDDGNKYS